MWARRETRLLTRLHDRARKMSMTHYHTNQNNTRNNNKKHVRHSNWNSMEEKGTRILTLLNTFTVVQIKNRATKIMSMSRSTLTKLIAIIKGFNNLSYVQFRIHLEIKPLSRLFQQDNESFRRFKTDCP